MSAQGYAPVPAELDESVPLRDLSSSDSDEGDRGSQQETSERAISFSDEGEKSSRQEISERTLSDGDEGDAPALVPTPAARPRKASAAAIAAGLVAPLPPGLPVPGGLVQQKSAPAATREALDDSQDVAPSPLSVKTRSVTFHQVAQSARSGAPLMKAPSQAVVAAQKFARRGRSASYIHRELEVKRIQAMREIEREKSGDVPAPVWFERDFFRRITTDRWAVGIIYLLLGLAPIITSGGSFMELYFDCPTHSYTIELLYAVGMFSFFTVPIELYRNLRLIVKGAWTNKDRLRLEKEVADEKIKAFLAAAEPATVRLQSAFRGKAARERLERTTGRKMTRTLSRTLSEDNTGAANDSTEAGGDSTGSRSKSRSRSSTVAGSAAEQLGKAGTLVRASSQDMVDPGMKSHLAKAVAAALRTKAQSGLGLGLNPLSDIHDMDSETLTEVLTGSGVTESAELVQRRLKAAAWVVHGVMGMKTDAMETAIEDLEFDAQEKAVEELLLANFEERSHKALHETRPEGDGETDQDRLLNCFPTADNPEKEEKARACCGYGCYTGSAASGGGCCRKNVDAEKQQVSGPLVQLAFDNDPRGMKRVVITPEAFNSLLWGCGVCVLIGLFFFAFAMATAIGAVGLIRADFELDSGQIGFMGRKVNDVFFPAKVCVSDITLHTYATLILLLWVPSCILASLVWPAWLVSLLLGTMLANDDVEDLMKDLTPENVKKFMSPPIPIHDDDTEKDAELREKKIKEKAERYWQVNAALPGAMLVVTMDQLTCWGTAMGHALVCCVMFSLGLVPTAVASHSTTMTVIGAKNASFAPFYTKNDHFTKTGSGQT
jgi:hypothetical protein